MSHTSKISAVVTEIYSILAPELPNVIVRYRKINFIAEVRELVF